MISGVSGPKESLVIVAPRALKKLRAGKQEGHGPSPSNTA